MAQCLGPVVCHQYVSGVLLWSASCGSLFVAICAQSEGKWWSCFGAQAVAYCLDPFVYHQYVSGVLLWSTNCGSLFVAICMPLVCEWCLA